MHTRYSDWIKIGANMDNEGSKSKEGKIVSLNPQNGLTEKQELFCQHICDGLSYSESYRRSGYSLDQAPKTINENASRLMGNSKVLARINQITLEREAETRTRKARLERYVLDALYSESKNAESDSARIQALHLLGKSQGLFIDKVEVQEDDQDIKTLEKRLKEKLDNLKAL